MAQRHSVTPILSAFVGRDHELTALRADADNARAGRGRITLLAGEPGVGKTRTAQETATYAEQRGMRVLWGRCDEGDGAPAYWPWAQAIRGYVQERTPDQLRSLMRAGAADVAQAFPILRERLPDLPPSSPTDPGQERFRLLDGLTTFLENVARERPLMLVLDDLHWADPASLLLLQFVARDIEHTALMVVGTYRHDEVQPGSVFSKALVELRRSAASRQLPLHGLAEPEVARLIEIVAGHKPSEGAVERISRQAQGNPLFVGEIVRWLLMQGGLDCPTSTGRGVPPGVREVIGARLDRLSSGCSLLLSVAAVVGSDFTLPLAERVTRLSQTVLLELVDEAVAARVLTPAPRPPGYCLAHPLIRETIYAELSSAQRVRLHREIGEALEALHASDLDIHVSELAYHFAEAAPFGQVDKALEYACRAAERAAVQFAHEDAAAAYERALNLLALQAEPNERRRAELLLALARTRYLAGDTDEATTPLLQAAEAARGLGDAEILARVSLAREGWRPMAGAPEDLVFNPLLEEALVALGAAETPLRARVLAQLASTLSNPPTRARAQMMAREAVEIARRIGDAATLARILYSATTVLYEPATVGATLALGAEALSAAQQIGDKATAANCHLNLAWPLLQLGDLAAADLHIELFDRLAHEVRHPSKLWAAINHHAMRALMCGRFDDAEALAYRALEIARRMPELAEQEAPQIFATLMLDLRRHQGRLSEVEASAVAFAARDTVPAWRATLALLLSELGRKDEAQRELDRLAANDFRDLSSDWLWMTTLGMLADACATVGDADRAVLIYEMLKPYAAHCIVVGDAAAYLGAVSRPLGRLAATLRRWSESCEHFEAAVETHERMGARPWLAHTQHNYAVMLLERGARGDRTRALQLLDAAGATASELGMKALLEAGLRVRAQHGDSDRVDESLVGSPEAATASLQRDGNTWVLLYAGAGGRWKDSKGMRYLDRLLRHPDQDVHVLDMLRTSDVDIDGEAPRTNGHGFAILDGSAKAAYREQLTSLRSELAEAEEFHDSGRSERLRAEIEAIAEQLAAAVGLGGRDRAAASATERARSTVTQRLKSAIKRIGDVHPSLADHLARRIKTGTFCVYNPDPMRPIRWELRDGPRRR